MQLHRRTKSADKTSHYVIGTNRTLKTDKRKKGKYMAGIAKNCKNSSLSRQMVKWRREVPIVKEMREILK